MTPRFRPAALLIGSALFPPATGLAQGPPPALGVPTPAQADPDALARTLAGWARNLEATLSGPNADPSARELAGDAGEMALAVDEFRATRADPPRATRALASVDATWQQLRRGLARPGLAADSVARATGEVDNLMAQLRAAVGLNPPPPGFYDAGQAPVGIENTLRLAHALVSRAEGLLGAVQARMAGDPNQAALANDAAQLVRLADGFHDAIDANQPPAVAAQAFAPVDQLADRVGRFATTAPVPPEVRRAWDSVAAVRAMIRQDLAAGVPPVGAVVATQPAPPPVVDIGPTLGLVDQMIGQVQTYEATFRSTAHNVPEGFAALADAQRLLAAAAAFRQQAAQGLPPNQLAFAFRDVDAHWQRLARRAARIARGRNGPYVQQVAAIGVTAQQLHDTLGMVGYAPGADYGPGGQFR